jgi:HK97 family phage prohead protease
MIPNRETRFWKVPALESRASDGAHVITGYALLFNRYSQNLGGFVEQIDSGAFTDSLARGNNIKSYFNHDPSRVLGTREAGNATFEADQFGIRYTVVLPDTSYARDLQALIAGGIVRGSSFTFRVLPDGDAWSYTEQGFPLRTIMAAEMYEAGPVTDPAYLDTEGEGAAVALRSLAVHLNRPFADVATAAAANELRSLMSEPPAPPSDLPSDEQASTQHVSRSHAARQLALAQRAR